MTLVATGITPKGHYLLELLDQGVDEITAQDMAHACYSPDGKTKLEEN